MTFHGYKEALNNLLTNLGINMQIEILLLLIVIFVPIATGFFLLLIPKRIKFVREALAFVVSLITFAATIQIFFNPLAEFNFTILNFGNLNLDLNIITNPLNKFMLLFLAGFGFLITLYSFRYMAGKSRNKEYYAFLLVTIGSGCGVLLSNHLLFFLIFWEFVSVSLYLLINTGTPEANEGSTKTFGMIGASDACLFLGICLIWILSESFLLSEINIQINGWLSYSAYFLMMIGALTKAGSMPFHTWIPSASKGAPASVMALLPASIDKLLGIYLLLILSTKLFVINNIIGMILMIIGAITIVGAVMMALIQHSLPKLLSYHAVSQVGYMILGIGTMTPIGIAGGLFHMLNNAIYKSCLFLCGGSVENKTQTQDLENLGGLAKVMPITFISCLICVLSISGVPPFNGFVSKWMIYQGTIENGNLFSLVFLVAAMFGSALTLASFIKVLFSVFLGQKSNLTSKVKKDVGFSMKLPIITLALLCILFGVFYKIPLDKFIFPASTGTVYPEGVWNSIIATGLIFIGLIVGLLIYLMGNVIKKSRKVDIFIGGEKIDNETSRISGTEFYKTIKSMSPFNKIFEKQGKGWFDPYKIFAKLGSGITYILKVIHNGFLPFYLAWTLVGIAVLILLFYFY